MSETQIHHNNHYIPQVYLRNFSSTPDKTKINVYRKLVSHKKVPLWNEKSIENTGTYKDLYNEITAQGESDAVETWLGNKFENQLSNVFSKVLTNSKLINEDWEVLIRFLAIQEVRVPSYYINEIPKVQQRLQQQLKELGDDLKLVNLEDLEDFTNSSSFFNTENDKESYPEDSRETLSKVKIEPDHCKKTIDLDIELNLGRPLWLTLMEYVPNQIHVLLEHKWTIVKPADGYFWITSDDPVMELKYCYKCKKLHFAKNEWVTPGNRIYLPLSPQHLLFTQIGDRRPYPTGTKLSIPETKNIVRAIADNSFSNIYSFQKDLWPVDDSYRVVDKAEYDRSITYWRNWHDLQSEQESRFIQENQEIAAKPTADAYDTEKRFIAELQQMS